MSDLNQSRLHEVLSYDPLSGKFCWRIKTCRKVVPGAGAGAIDAAGYVAIGIDGGRYRAHRLAFFWMTGSWPAGVDHIDGDRANNTWANLREANHSQNGQNLKPHKRNTSGFIGVSKTRSGKWRAQISLNRKWINLGIHETPEAASLAYTNGKASIHSFNPTVRNCNV